MDAVGAFNPMMRSHGTDLSREIYHFGQKGEPIYDAIESTIRLRYSCYPISIQLPGRSQQAVEFHARSCNGLSHDKNVWDIKHQYMFGKSILGCSCN